METLEILERLIAFPTISSNPNRALINYCVEILEPAGADIAILEDETGKKANLYATIGPQNAPGVLLSGHTDVVPVDGQNWTKPAFELTQSDGKAFGRGTTDMKGFVACALSAAKKAGREELKTPLHLAFSYDEEIGCIGVRSMIDMLAAAPFRPRFCIVGEPTLMMVATGHKGKTALKVTCKGVEGHSALAPSALNAIHLATDLIEYIRELQSEVSAGQIQDDDYDIPYTTLHVAQIASGGALNIVPNHAEFRFEIRNLADDDPAVLLRKIEKRAEEIVGVHRHKFPDAKMEIEVTNTYPPLSTANDAEVVSFVKSLTGGNSTLKVAFGTEGGLFSSVLDIPTVVCGPGSMEQGHKPDEFVSLDQLQQCDAMLEALLSRLKQGL